jgi:hypothetical protein
MGRDEDSTLSPRVSPQRDILLALAARCEAEAPSRELDAAIFEATSGARAYIKTMPFSAKNAPQDRMITGLPHYTRSLDDDVALIPEGWAWFVEWIGSPFVEGQARLWIPLQRTQHLRVEQVTAEAKTPALALCAAALRARAAQAEGTSHE